MQEDGISARLEDGVRLAPFSMVITMRNERLICSHVVQSASRGGTGRWQRYDRPRRPASQASAARADTEGIRLVTTPR